MFTNQLSPIPNHLNLPQNRMSTVMVFGIIFCFFFSSLSNCGRYDYSYHRTICTLHIQHQLCSVFIVTIHVFAMNGLCLYIFDVLCMFQASMHGFSLPTENRFEKWVARWMCFCLKIFQSDLISMHVMNKYVLCRFFRYYFCSLREWIPNMGNMKWEKRKYANGNSYVCIFWKLYTFWILGLTTMICYTLFVHYRCSILQYM